MRNVQEILNEACSGTEWLIGYCEYPHVCHSSAACRRRCTEGRSIKVHLSVKSMVTNHCTCMTCQIVQQINRASVLVIVNEGESDACTYPKPSKQRCPSQ